MWLYVNIIQKYERENKHLKRAILTKRAVSLYIPVGNFIELSYNKNNIKTLHISLKCRSIENNYVTLNNCIYYKTGRIYTYINIFIIIIICNKNIILKLMNFT